MSNYLAHMESIGEGKAFDRRVSYLKYNFSEFLNIIEKKPSSILEIGPGIGELIHILNSKNINDIDIIDNDQAVLNFCSKKYKISNSILAKNLFLSKYIRRKYDLIVLTQVFEHIPKSAYILWIKTLYQALKPGGHIIITVPNGANPLVGTERYGDLQHENMFTVYSFRELMTFANLKNAKFQIKGFEIPPNSAINIFRIILQKTLHGVFILMMMINGAIYQTLMTPNITLIISKDR